MIKWAFEAFAQGGWSLVTLAEELNRRGLTTKESPKRPARLISAGFLHKVLTNKFYFGTFTSGRVEYQGTYEPLVTRDLWDAVDSRLTQNRTYSKPAARKWFCFRPFTKCGYCGASITAYDKPGRHGRGKFIYYECTNSKKRLDPLYYQRKFGTENCIQRRWKESEIDDLIKAEIGRLYVDDVVIEEVRARLKRTNIAEEAYERKELRRLEAERTRKKNHLRLSYQDRLDGRLTAEQYDEISAEVQADLNRVESDIAGLSRHNVKYREQGSRMLELLGGIKDVYEKADMPGKRELLEVMLDKITLKEEPTVIWHFPFSTLFTLGKVFREGKNWGQSINEFITYLRHSPQGATLKALGGAVSP